MKYGKVVILYGDVPIIREETIRELVEKSVEKNEKATILNTGIYCFDIQTLMETIEEIKPNNNQKEYYLTDVIGIISEKRRNSIRISCKR